MIFRQEITNPPPQRVSAAVAAKPITTILSALYDEANKTLLRFDFSFFFWLFIDFAVLVVNFL